MKAILLAGLRAFLVFWLATIGIATGLRTGIALLRVGQVRAEASGDEELALLDRACAERGIVVTPMSEHKRKE